MDLEQTSSNPLSTSISDLLFPNTGTDFRGIPAKVLSAVLNAWHVGHDSGITSATRRPFGAWQTSRLPVTHGSGLDLTGVGDNLQPVQVNRVLYRSGNVYPAISSSHGVDDSTFCAICSRIKCTLQGKLYELFD